MRMSGAALLLAGFFRLRFQSDYRSGNLLNC
ncbi:Protein of unknown function [Pyronema omphalodes CBS 100304]|uniref:Uncharacterized protein n=1 Tax=Pyronema omphalodes (strain CBS 100304) TaxID=1076935 RepID=U4LUN9_PYROM|nr:Protein of unknown function [Pyronema omphalodes CBS 100304]